MTILNTVCTLAICATVLPGVSPSIHSTKGVAIQIQVNRKVPMMLNIRWIIVERLALTFVPIEAKTAVMQVPMFCPNNTYTA